MEYDKKYDIIKEKFDLERASDILWFKFTDKHRMDFRRLLMRMCQVIV